MMPKCVIEQSVFKHAVIFVFVSIDDIKMCALESSETFEMYRTFVVCVNTVLFVRTSLHESFPRSHCMTLTTLVIYTHG